MGLYICEVNKLPEQKAVICSGVFVIFRVRSLRAEVDFALSPDELHYFVAGKHIMLWYGEVHGLIIHNALKHDEVISVGMHFAYLETFFGICDYTAIFAGLSVVDIDIAAP